MKWRGIVLFVATVTVATVMADDASTSVETSSTTSTDTPSTSTADTASASPSAPPNDTSSTSPASTSSVAPADHLPASEPRAGSEGATHTTSVPGAASSPVHAAVRENLCEKCTCTPSSIVCECTKEWQEVNVKEDSFTDLRNLERFEVRKCDALHLSINAFHAADHLRNLTASSIRNVTIDRDAFSRLESLLIHEVRHLELKPSALLNIKDFESIVIQKANIPVLKKFALYRTNDLRRLLLQNVQIDKVEEKGFYVDLHADNGAAEISNTMIGNIQTDGIQIGNATNITIVNTTIKNAETSSIKLSSHKILSLKGNTFERGVNAKAALIFFNATIDFAKNKLWNINSTSSLDSSELEKDVSHTLLRLASENSGNSLVCECNNKITNTSGTFFQNLCLDGCEKATISAFLKTCKEASSANSKDILNKLCGGTVVTESYVSTTTRTTNKTGHGSAIRMSSVHIIPLMVIVLFHKVI